ncbi:MAG: asparagine synthase-related protein, partial [Steroidobacteraceae bacterium]
RESRLCAMVRAANGRVLLTGVGGDNLFTGNMFFFADLLVHGRVGPTFREMVRRAAIGRVSFWELAYRNALLPLLPRALQYRLVQDAGQMPPWVLRETVRRYDLDSRASMPSRYAGRIGGKYHHAVVTEVAAGIDGFTADVLEDQLDVRHPYLYRPLVEFALRLPPELCARPNERKWVLREAMRGILPDGVRTRVGKGTPYGRLAWSMGAQRALLEPLVRDPILADLGVVDAAKWRAFFEMVQFKPDSRQQLHGTILHTLAIEAWLQMRSGRWPRGYSSSLYRHDKVHTPSA